MTNEKRLQYKKAYVELYEIIIKRLSKEEQSKIPKIVMDNLIKSKDTSYSFEFDESKDILEQDLMIETQALLVGIYEKYLAPESEKDLWEKYDCICLNKIEEKRIQRYNPDDIFKKSNQEPGIQQEFSQNNVAMVEYKEPIFRKIMNKIKIFSI